MILTILQVMMLIPVAIILIIGAGAIACCVADRVRDIIDANHGRWK